MSTKEFGVRSLTVTAMLGVLAGCASSPHSISERQAISAASTACRLGWGKVIQDYENPQWQARLKGDHWYVWSGDEIDPLYSVEVPLNGTKLAPSKSCRLRFDD